MTTRSLRILVDGRMLLGRVSGINRFVTKLVDALASQSEIKITVLSGQGDQSVVFDRPNVDVLATEFSKADRKATRRLWCQERHLARYVDASSADVYHATWNTDVPRRRASRVPTLLTVHDLIPWHDPGHSFYSTAERVCYRYAIKSSVKRASLVTTVSDYVRRDVMTTLGVDASRVCVIPNGVTLPDTASIQPTPDEQPYVLYVGGFEHRKNIAAVLAAVDRFVRRYDESLELRLTGSRELLCPRAARVLDGLSRDARVRFLGVVDDDELAHQYAGASALLMLSTHEGFGLPVLEAMAYGCPVVAASNASLPEVVGDAGILVDPDQPDEVAHGLHRLMTDPAFRADFVRRGKERAATFGWDMVADRYRSLYERLAVGGQIEQRSPVGTAAIDFGSETSGNVLTSTATASMRAS